MESLKLTRSVAALSASAFLLTACANPFATSTTASPTTSTTTTTTSPTTVANQLATDVQTLAQGLATALTDLKTAPGINAAQLAQIQVYVGDVQAAASVIAGATSSPSASDVTQIETTVNNLVAFAATLPLPTTVSYILAAASALLPTLEAEIGSLAAPETLAAKPVLGVPPMTPALARAILKAGA